MTGRILPPEYDAAGRPQVGHLPQDSVGLGLALVFLLGLLLRVVDLGGQSLWIDEILTLRQGQVPGYSLWTQFLDDAQAALPMVLATMMSRISENEAWLRLPSALLGALSVPLLFEVVRRFASDRAAMIAALLLAIHPMHIDHSQEIRGYAFMIFFGLAATLTVLDAGRRPGLRQQAMLVVCGVACGLSNQQGLIWMGGLALGLAVSGRVGLRDLLYWAAPFALVLILLAPWWTTVFEVHDTARLVPGTQTGEELRGTTTWSVWALPWAGFMLSFGRTLGPTVEQLHLGTAPTVSVVVLAALAALTVVILAGTGIRRLGRRGVEVFAWILPVVVIAVFLAIRNVKPFNPRYVFACLPVLLLFVAVGIDTLKVNMARLLLLLWIGLTVVSLGHYYFDPDHRQEDVRAAARFIEERAREDDVVIAPTVRRVFEFYDQGRTPLIPLFAADPSEDFVATLSGAETGPRYLWYVEARPWVHDPEGRLRSWLDAGFRQVSRTTFGGTVLTLYDRERPGGVD